MAPQGDGVTQYWLAGALVLATAVVAFYAQYRRRLAARKAFARAHSVSPEKMRRVTAAEMARHDGTDASLPIWVGIKGFVYDVSSKREAYGPGGSYHIFAGKDCSRALGMSSLKAEDCVADYSGLDEKQLKTLDGWEKFFNERYPRVAALDA